MNNFESVTREGPEKAKLILLLTLAMAFAATEGSAQSNQPLDSSSISFKNEKLRETKIIFNPSAGQEMRKQNIRFDTKKNAFDLAKDVITFDEDIAANGSDHVDSVEVSQHIIRDAVNKMEGSSLKLKCYCHDGSIQYLTVAGGEVVDVSTDPAKK